MNVKIDSRKIEKGDTFVALRGIDHDGHAYIRQAIENGAAKIICEEGSYEVETCIVEDTRAYLVNYLKDTYYEQNQQTQADRHHRYKRKNYISISASPDVE